MAQFNLGQTATVGDFTDSGNATAIPAFQIILTQTAALVSLTFTVTTVVGQLNLGLYADSSGAPGARLGSTGLFTPSTGANVKPLAIANLAPGTYWLVHSPTSDSLAYPGFNASGTCAFGTVTTGTGSLPNPYGTVASTNTFRWAFFGTFNSADPPLINRQSRTEIAPVDEAPRRSVLQPQPAVISAAPLFVRRGAEAPPAVEEPIRYVDGSFVTPTSTPPLVQRPATDIAAAEEAPRRTLRAPPSAVAGLPPLAYRRRPAEEQVHEDRAFVRARQPQALAVASAPLIAERFTELFAAEESPRRSVNVPAPQSSNALPLTATRRSVDESSTEERASRVLLTQQPAATLPSPLLARRLADERAPEEAARAVRSPPVTQAPVSASPIPSRRAAEPSIVEELTQRVRLIAAGAIAGIAPLFGRRPVESGAAEERSRSVAMAPQAPAAVVAPLIGRRVAEVAQSDERPHLATFVPASAIVGAPPLHGQRATEEQPIEERRAIMGQPSASPTVVSAPPLFARRTSEDLREEERPAQRALLVSSLPVPGSPPLGARRQLADDTANDVSARRAQLAPSAPLAFPPLLARAAREDAFAEEAQRRARQPAPPSATPSIAPLSTRRAPDETIIEFVIRRVAAFFGQSAPPPPPFTVADPTHRVTLADSTLDRTVRLKAL
jgi:hypothetical protein